MTRTKFVLALFVVAVMGIDHAFASPISTEAFDNATVQPGGPRTAPSGKNFFNIEGSVNGNFASYGVADFSYGAQPTVLGINSATVEFTQSNAGFTTDGPVIISLDTSATLVDIQNGTSPLAFDGSDPGTATDVTDGDLALTGLGSFSFVEVANGNVDSYALTLSPAIEAELISRLNAGGTIRLVIGTGSTDVAATWAGFGSTSGTGPTLIIDAQFVPEPTTVLLLAICTPALLVRRRIA